MKWQSERLKCSFERAGGWEFLLNVVSRSLSADCPVDSSLLGGEPLQGHSDLGLYGASQLGNLDQLRCSDVR